MRKFIDLLRGRKRREAEEALARLKEQSDEGPEAARRFEEAARQIIAATKTPARKT